MDEVYDAASEVLSRVSLRTVYQALHDLADLGEIRLAPIGGGALRVDVRTDGHAHLVCERCGRVHDVDVDASAVVPRRSQRHGYSVERTDVVFAGRCGPCRAAEVSAAGRAGS